MKKMNISPLVIAFWVTITLSGCFDDTQDIKVYMVAQFAVTKKV